MTGSRRPSFTAGVAWARLGPGLPNALFAFPQFPIVRGGLTVKASLTLGVFVIALLVLGSGLRLSAQDTRGKSFKAAVPQMGCSPFAIRQRQEPGCPGWLQEDTTDPT